MACGARHVSMKNADNNKPAKCPAFILGRCNIVCLLLLQGLPTSVLRLHVRWAAPDSGNGPLQNVAVSEPSKHALAAFTACRAHGSTGLGMTPGTRTAMRFSRFVISGKANRLGMWNGPPRPRAPAAPETGWKRPSDLEAACSTQDSPRLLSDASRALVCVIPYGLWTPARVRFPEASVEVDAIFT